MTNETIPRNTVCNGIQDCSNGRDESQCVALSNSFPINENSTGYGNIIDWLVAIYTNTFILTNFRDPTVNPSGYVYVRFNGQWYLYCYNEWHSKHWNALCKAIGYDHATDTRKRVPANLDLDESYCTNILHLSCV